MSIQGIILGQHWKLNFENVRHESEWLKECMCLVFACPKTTLNFEHANITHMFGTGSTQNWGYKIRGSERGQDLVPCCHFKAKFRFKGLSTPGRNAVESHCVVLVQEAPWPGGGKGGTNTSWYFYKPFPHSNKQWGEVKVSESINENVNPTSL